VRSYFLRNSSTAGIFACDGLRVCFGRCAPPICLQGPPCFKYSYADPTTSVTNLSQTAELRGLVAATSVASSNQKRRLGRMGILSSGRIGRIPPGSSASSASYRGRVRTAGTRHPKYDYCSCFVFACRGAAARLLSDGNSKPRSVSSRPLMHARLQFTGDVAKLICLPRIQGINLS
jgi:hypothetical protein